MLSSIKDSIKHIILTELGDSQEFNFKDRITVVSDLEMFRWKEDEYIWEQKRGKIVTHYSIYLDEHFVSGFDEDWIAQRIMLDFWKGLKTLVKNNKVALNVYQNKERQEIEEIERKEEVKEQKRKIDALPEATETQKLAKEAIKRVSKTAPRRNSGRKRPVV
jgi:hypothetical protein